MPNEIYARIAGVDISISCGTSGCSDLLGSFLQNFLVPSAPKDPFKVRFSTDDPMMALGFSNTAKEERANLWGLNLGMGHMDKNGDFAVIADMTPENIQVAQFINDNLLRVCLQYAMPKRGGLLLHSSAIENHGKSLVFIAPNEGGKSTISANSGRKVLSDDCVGIKKDKSGAWFACSTPWGRVHSSGEYPIEALFFIEKSDRFFCEPISSIDVVKKIFANLSLTFSDLEEYPDHSLEDVLHIVSGVSTAIPAFRLGFRRDDNVVELLRNNENYLIGVKGQGAEVKKWN